MTETCVTKPRKSHGSAAQDWARALETTSHITQPPERLFSTVIAEHAAQLGDTPALLSDRECLTYRGLAERLEPIFALGARSGHRQRRLRRFVDAEPARIYGCLAGYHASRRRGGLLNTNLTGLRWRIRINIVAPQHLIVADELVGCRMHGTAACSRLPQRSGFTAARWIRLSNSRRANHSARSERRTADHRRSGAVHLHLRHHRIAESRQGEPRPRDAVDPLVRRPDGYAARRSHVQLPSDVSQRGRRASAGSRSGWRRFRGVREKFSAAPILERHCPVGLHAGAVHWRALPLPAWHAEPLSTKPSIGFGWPAAMDSGPIYGTIFRTVSASRRFFEFYAATEGNVSLI